MKLTVGQDLQPVYDLIFRVKRNYPQYVQNLRRIIHNVDLYISRYNDSMMLYGRTQKQKYYKDAENALENMAKLLTVLERAELLGYLAGDQKIRD